MPETVFVFRAERVAEASESDGISGKGDDSGKNTGLPTDSLGVLDQNITRFTVGFRQKVAESDVKPTLNA